MKYNRIAFILSFLAGTFLTFSTSCQEVNFNVLKSLQDWQSAKNNAKSSGRDIFLDIYASWCGPCKMMDANVYTDAAVSEYYNSNYINLKLDGESDLGVVLAAQYKLTAYPSMYFINSGELLIHQLIGYREPEALIEAGKLVRDSGNRYLELTESYQSATLAPEQTDELIDLLIKFERKDILIRLAGEKIKSYTDADILNPANKEIVIAVGGDLESYPVKTVMQNAASLKLSWGTQDFNQYLSDAFNVSMQIATETQDKALMEKIAEEFVPVYMIDNAERIPEAKLTTRKIYYSEIKDWTNYINSVEKQFNDFENGNTRFLYLEAYYIVENQLFDTFLLDKSKEWLDKVIAVQPDFDSYFLAAVVNTYRQDFDKARFWMGKAESVAVSEDETKSLEELKKYLEEL